MVTRFGAEIIAPMIIDAMAPLMITKIGNTSSTMTRAMAPGILSG